MSMPYPPGAMNDANLRIDQQYPSTNHIQNKLESGQSSSRSSAEFYLIADKRQPQQNVGLHSHFSSSTTMSPAMMRGEELPAIPGKVEEKHGHGHDDDHMDPYDPNRPMLSFRQRMQHFTFAWYTLTMSTAGLSLLAAAQPFQWPGLRQIGFGFYIVNIIMFTCVCFGLVTRFFLYPGEFKAALTHPREGFFLPTFFLSVATLITSTQRYVIPENDAALLWAIRASFWAYLVVTAMLAVGQYSYVFAAHSFGLQTMMPTWILPIFPIMLSGTIAAVIASTQPDAHAIGIVVAGLTCQGLGLSVAFMMYSHMVGRLMQAGLPNREHRPGLFMCVGPPAFTALAFIGLAEGVPDQLDFDLDGIVDVHVVKTMGVVGAAFFWALSFWWFGIAIFAVIQSPPKYFHLGWWAGVFPNTGFTLATISLSKALQSQPIKIAATVMSGAIVVAYCFVLFHHIKAVLSQEIMYPGRDENVEDH